jgi:hypothetical protein
MTRRLGTLAVLATTQVVALVLAHELVYLARYGSRYGEALVHAGHGESWTAAATLVVSLGLVLAFVAGARLAYVGALVRRAGARPGPASRLELAPLLRAWLRNAVVLSIVTVGLLTIQENVEHGAAGLATSGPLLLLTPEYAGGLWIALGVAIAVAFVVALFDWRRRILLARLRDARAGNPRRAGTKLRPASTVDRPAGSILGRHSALRAPPAAALA